jgi:hypothetical protein
MKYAQGAVALAGAIAMVAGSAAAQPMHVQSFPYKSGPVTITSCTVNEDKSNSTVTANSLRINYFPNVPGRKLTSITFRVRYAGTPVTVTDTGSFDYNASITHQFNQLGGHAWAGASPEVCRVVTATFDNGEVVNPHYDGPGGMGGMNGMRPGMAPPPGAGGPGDTAAPPGAPADAPAAPPAPAPNASGGTVPAPAPTPS